MSQPSCTIQKATISNPKRYKEPIVSGARIFPYYAGFSGSFVRQLIASLQLKSDSIILDPWNGSGTTTKSALDLGFRAIGIDLNPAMVVVAKASLISDSDHKKVFSILKKILDRLSHSETVAIKRSDDPLETWLQPSSASYIRFLEYEINKILISPKNYRPLNNQKNLDSLSPIAAFFYVCLFKVTRKLLSDFVASNPTWIKNPKSKHQRKRPSRSFIANLFAQEVSSISSLSEINDSKHVNYRNHINLNIGNAESLSLASDSIDLIISSPPYCTRIDYAVSTSFELAVLGFSREEFIDLRRKLTGTSTVQKFNIDADSAWGPTCLDFLKNLQAHPSVASHGYYYKNHAQYFKSLSLSVAELSRVLKSSGLCFLVIQDSYYKDIYNDLPLIITEMASNAGLTLIRREDFKTSSSMAQVNAKSKRYLSSRIAIESVLIFKKTNSETKKRI